MSVPKYEEYMYPVLKILSNSGALPKKEICKLVAEHMNLTDEQKSAILPSQTMPTYINRIGWALSYLKFAGLLMSPRRGIYKLTEEGVSVISSGITHIDNDFLLRYDSFKEFLKRSKDSPHHRRGVLARGAESEAGGVESPDEAILSNYKIIKTEVCNDLLNYILEQSPYVFESLVLRLLEAMGYGTGTNTPKSRDGGIDGIINEDRLGLGKIYLQAKRYGKENKVGSRAIQEFIGALHTEGAKKGVFITTSEFTSDAKSVVAKSKDMGIVTIDGMQLVELMFEYNVGMSVEKTYEIKKIDYDFLDALNI